MSEEFSILETRLDRIEKKVAEIEEKIQSQPEIVSETIRYQISQALQGIK